MNPAPPVTITRILFTGARGRQSCCLSSSDPFRYPDAPVPKFTGGFHDIGPEDQKIPKPPH